MEPSLQEDMYLSLPLQECPEQLCVDPKVQPGPRDC